MNRIMYSPPAVILVNPIPAPSREIPFVIVNKPLHVAEPAGTRMVSPAFALETAELTSVKEGLAAVITSEYVMASVLLMLLEFGPALTVRVTDWAPAVAYV